MNFFNSPAISFLTVMMLVVIALYFMLIYAADNNPSWKKFFWLSSLMIFLSAIAIVLSLIFCSTEREFFNFFSLASICIIILTSIIISLWDIRHSVVIIDQAEPAYYELRLLSIFRKWYRVDLNTSLKFDIGAENLKDFFLSLFIDVKFSLDTMKHFYLERVDYSSIVNQERIIELNKEDFYTVMRDNIKGYVFYNSDLSLSNNHGKLEIDGAALVNIINNSMKAALSAYEQAFQFRPKIESIAIDGTTTIGMKIYHKIDY